MKCFKAYDIRGRVPDELNDTVAYRIGRAFSSCFKPQQVAVGYDVRLSSPPLAQALSQGLRDGGAAVLDIGLCGTEEIYFATFDRELDGGIMVTASHNPMDYNGMKLVRAEARPISGDSGLFALRDLAASGDFAPVASTGDWQQDHDKSAYIQHLLGYIGQTTLQPLKIVVNPGNGGAGLVLDLLEPYLPVQFIKIQYEPDGRFPNGIPNPLLPDRRAATRQAVLESGADFGLAWDGDFDRCFFFDERGEFIEGYYLVGLLAQALLRQEPGGRVIHDPRLSWNTIELVQQAGGVPVQCKTGHAFIKERMRQEDAIYGGEMSAHHYFRDFAYCDSGMIPWLLIAAELSRAGKPLSSLIADRQRAYPCSGEINFQVADTDACIARVLAHYDKDQPTLDRTDGLSLEFSDWRLNLRASNTEPLLRLNIETRANPALLADRTQELTRLLT